jgi:hypothetical protein
MIAAQSTLKPSAFLSKLQVNFSFTSPEIPSMAPNAERAPLSLSDDYQPTQFDVECGRGKGSYNRPGNKRFRAVVREFIPEYSAAKTKCEKGSVLNAIVERVQSQNNGSAHFIKRKNGEWFVLPKDQAREKVGHIIREALTEAAGADERIGAKKLFAVKQNNLLALQNAIFQHLVAQSFAEAA